MEFFLEFTFDFTDQDKLGEQLKHFYESYRKYYPWVSPGELRIVSEVIGDDYRKVTYDLYYPRTVIDLEAFLARYYSYSPNKFELDIYPVAPKDFTLLSRDIRWKLASNIGGAYEGLVYDDSAGLHHLPTNLYVKCTNEGSKKDNKWMARKLLTAKVYKQLFKKEEWRSYLLGLAITDLNNQEESSSKLEEVENKKPSLLEALKKEDGNFLLINCANKEHIREWLESLAN